MLVYQEGMLCIMIDQEDVRGCVRESVLIFRYLNQEGVC